MFAKRESWTVLFAIVHDVEIAYLVHGIIVGTTVL